MIAVVYGTTGELIKLAPVLATLRDRRERVLSICTGQQVQQIPALLDDFRLAQPDLWLGRGYRERDLERASWIPVWLGSVAARYAGRFGVVAARLRAGPGRPLVLVHGDTFTTVIGALIGRSLRVPVAHLEAGLRSGDWRNPFPEELDRLAASKLASIHLTPGAWAADNLRRARVKGEIVDCGGNTIRDALDLVPAGAVDFDLPDVPFGLVSIHRFELLGNARAFRDILTLLSDAARRVPLLFIDHPVTAASIANQGLAGLFHAGLRRIPRQRYFKFISLLKASGFLVTDSGGSQEECAYLGHPCLVHRAATERQDGLGGPVTLSRLDLGVAAGFLADPLRHATAPVALAERPTDIALAFLDQAGFIGSGSAA